MKLCEIQTSNFLGARAVDVRLAKPVTLFDSALVFGTLKSLPAQLPESIAGIWIENGTTALLKAA